MISQLAFPLRRFPRILLIQTLLLLAFALPFAQAKATPVTFNFTGTVSEYILLNGSLWKGSDTSPDWYGKTISGSVTIDTALAADRSLPSDPSRVNYGPEWNDDPERASWVTWKVVGPDGRQLDIPAVDVPIPGPDQVVDASLVMKLPSPEEPHSWFYVQRWLDFIPDYPRMGVLINLVTDVDNANTLINGLDLESLVVQPQAATYSNWGWLVYYSDAGDAYDYNFTVDSFVLATSQVPEPNSLLLVVLALGTLAWRRHSWRVRRYFLSLMLMLGFANAQATPVTFNFTGTIHEDMLLNGQPWRNTVALTEWYGKQVSGSVTIDLDLAVDISSPGNPTEKVYFLWNNTEDRASWVDWTLVNPDGVEIHIPSGVLPKPYPEGDMNSAMLILKEWGPFSQTSEIYLLRHLDYIPDLPKMGMSLHLAATGDNAKSLISSLELGDLVVQAQAANAQNYGSVIYDTGMGNTYEYLFTVDEFWRAPSDVPEPAGWILAVLAVGGLMVRRGLFVMR